MRSRIPWMPFPVRLHYFLVPRLRRLRQQVTLGARMTSFKMAAEDDETQRLWFLDATTRTKDDKRLKVYTQLLRKMSERQAIAERPSTSQRQSITRFIRYEHLLAGVSGGVTSTLVLHPLDLIKIRFQGKMQGMTSYVLYSFVCFSCLYSNKAIRPAHGIIAWPGHARMYRSMDLQV